MQPRSQAPALWWLLVIPFAALIFPGLYAHAEPPLFGLPFFYWYQFVWLILTSALTGIVYQRNR